MPTASRLIGRDPELSLLRQHAAAARGEGRLVLVTGEAGVGKTALARAAAADSGLPLVETAPPAGEAAFATLATLTGAPATLADVLGAALERASDAGPLAVLLDDLHLADDATLALLRPLAGALERMPVLLLGVYRSDELAPGHALRRLRSDLRRDGRLHELALAPLDAVGTGALLGQLLGEAAEGALLEAVHARSEGLPFVIVELAEALRAAGDVDLLADGLPLPESVRDEVAGRVARLAREGRAALEAAAVAGRSFDPELARAAAGLVAWPDETIERGLVTAGAEGELVFRHALVRDALYHDLSWQRRRALHRALAELVEAGGSAPLAAAEHWLRAGEPAHAREALLAAGEEAFAAHAYASAAAALRRALGLWPDREDEAARLDAVERLASCDELAGDEAGAVRAWRTLASAREARGESLRAANAFRRLASALEVQGTWDDALEARESAAAAFTRAGEPAEAAAERLLAAAHLRSAASFRAALDLLALAAVDARAAQRADLAARVAALEGNVRARMGEGERGIELVRWALTAALDASLTAVAAEIYQRLADSLEHAGDYAAATTTYDEAFAFCAAGGLEPTAQICLACLAAVLRQTGEWDRAERICRDVLAAPASPPHARAAAAATLGSIEALRGDVRRGRALLLEAASLSRRIDLTTAGVIADWGLALLDDAQDRRERAADRCRALLERWHTTEERHYTVAPLRWSTTMLAETGDDAGARACAAALARIAADTGQPESLSALAHALGETALLAGDADGAAEHLDRATALLQPVGAPFERMESQRRAAAALLAAGRREEAVERLAAAYRLARRLRLGRSSRRLAAALAELGASAGRRLNAREREELGLEGLSRRELDVVRLLAAGRTNREIAGVLFLSPRTVDAHVRNVLRKLDCRSRAEAARRATELGLLGV